MMSAVIGAATKRLSQEFRQQHPEIPWRDIAGMRDVLLTANIIVAVEFSPNKLVSEKSLKIYLFKSQYFLFKPSAYNHLKPNFTRHYYF
jgi:hypothetical protein